MYQPKDKSYAIIAVIYYLIYWFGLFVAGILYQNGIQSGMNIIYCVLFVLGILIVFVKDKKINNLGFGKENRKKNLIVATIIVGATFFVIWIFSDLSVGTLILQMLYNLFYIAAIEEILFRGLIQNYLFGFKVNKYLVFILGAIFFSFMHIPFQMFVHDNVSISYVIQAIPNLIWLSVIKNLLKQLEKNEDILMSYGLTNFAISSHTEGKQFSPWQMFDKSRYTLAKGRTK